MKSSHSGQTREYQNDQTSQKRSRLWLCPGLISKNFKPKKGTGELFFFLTTVSHIGFRLSPETLMPRVAPRRHENM